MSNTHRHVALTEAAREDVIVAARNWMAAIYHSAVRPTTMEMVLLSAVDHLNAIEALYPAMGEYGNDAGASP